MTRSERLLSVLSEHPEGITSEILLTRSGEADERQVRLQALRTLAARGEVSISGKKGRTEVASALVQPVPLLIVARTDAAPHPA